MAPLNLEDVIEYASPNPPLPREGFGQPAPRDIRSLDIGDVGNAIMAALGAPRAAVQQVLAGGTPLPGDPALERFQRGVEQSAEQWKAMNKGPLAMTGLPAMMQHMGPMATDVATDPLSYVGLGLPAKVAGLMPAGSRAAEIFMAAQKADDFPARVLELMARTAGKGASAAGTALDATAPGVHNVINPAKWIRPDVANEATGGRTTRQATDLIDWFRNMSKETGYKRAEREAGDVRQTLVANRRNIQRDVTDDEAIVAATKFAESKGRRVTPNDILDNLAGKYEYEKYMGGKALMQGYNEALVKAYEEAPNALSKMAVVEVMRNLDVQIKKVLDDLYGARVTTKRATAAREDNREFYQAFMDQVRVRAKAATDTAYDISRQFDDADLPPDVENRLMQTANWAMSRVTRARDTLSEGVFPVILRPRTVPGTGGKGKVPEKYPGRAKRDTMEARYGEFVDRLGQEEAILGAVHPIIGRALGDRADLVSPHRINNMMQGRMAEIETLLQGQPGVLASVSDPQRGAVTDTWKNMIKGSREAASVLNQMEQAFGRAYEKLSAGVPYEPLGKAAHPGVQTPGRVVGHINERLAELARTGVVPEAQAVNSTKDLVDFLRRNLSNADANEIKTLSEKFKDVDLLHADPIDAAFGRAQRLLRSDYGLPEADTFKERLAAAPGAIFHEFNALFKDQAIASVAYPVVNTMGAMITHAMSGQNPFPVLRLAMKAATQNALDEAHGLQVYRPAEGIRQITNMTGERPYGAARGVAGLSSEVQSAGATTATRGMHGVAQSPWERFPGPSGRFGPFAGNAGLGALGGALGGASGAIGTPSDATEDERRANIISGAAKGAAGLGLLYPTMSRYVHPIARGVEDAFRGAEWELKFRETMLDNAPKFENIIREAFEGAEPQIIEGARTMTRPDRALIDNVLEFVREQDHMLTPEGLGTLLVKSGVSNDARKTAVTQWRNLNHQANVAGQEWAAKHQFDYENLNNFEQFMREFAPFSTYALKANPFFIQHLVQKPIIFTTLQAMQNEMGENKEASGLTSRVAGAANIGIADQFWSGLLGYPVMAYYNPIKSMFPWSNMARQGEPRPDENQYETLLRMADMFGIPSPTPVVQTAARIGGAQGDAPPQNIIRLAGPLEGLGAMLGENRGRGINIGAAPMAAERAIREAGILSATGPQEVAEPNITSANNRVAELYLQKYGKPLSEDTKEAIPYLQAMALRSGPIWDEAMRQGAKERGARAGIGFIAGPLSPQTFVTPEEARVRKARHEERVLAPAFGRKIQQAAVKDMTAKASPEDIETMRQASLYLIERHFPGAGMQPAVQALLDNGTYGALNALRQEMHDLTKEKAPLSTAYPVTGGPEESAIQAQSALSHLLPLNQPGGEALMGISSWNQKARSRPGVPTIETPSFLRQSSQAATKERDALSLTNPQLPAYREWKKKNPHGTIDDFLRAYRRAK